MVELEDMLVGQIPYANISRLGNIEIRKTRSVVLCVRDIARSDTFWPGGMRLRNLNQQWFGFDYAIEGGYAMEPLEIEQLLRNKLAQLPVAERVD